LLKCKQVLPETMLKRIFCTCFIDAY